MKGGETVADDSNLDQPREFGRRAPWRRTVDPEFFGKFAEGAARFLGTARFIAWMTVFIIAWLLWNAPIGPERPPLLNPFDPYPFIFLTLMLSLQASYAAPLILLAQNRQEARDRVAAEQDRESAARSQADMEFLAREVASLRLALGDVATRDFLRSELRNLLTELEKANEEVAVEVTDPDEGDGTAAPAAEVNED
ncbi:MAG: DUF1003 domain-containing protein [Aeromicrobium sp.]|nr:MAG: DUF1003 domain-containing protein [Aeromicrobium sp.]